MKSLKFAALVMLMAAQPLVLAQNALSGVDTVDILIETLDDDARKCGITQDMLDAAVRLPLASSRINVRQGLDLPYVYVNANVLTLSGGLCVVGVRLEFKKWSESERAVGGFWDTGGVTTGSPTFVSRKIAQNVEGWTKQFIAAWLKAN